MQRESLIKNSEIYFNPWDTIFEGNPRRILERGESVTLPPMFILQGEGDDHVLPVVQERFRRHVPGSRRRDLPRDLPRR